MLTITETLTETQLKQHVGCFYPSSKTGKEIAIALEILSATLESNQNAPDRLSKEIVKWGIGLLEFSEDMNEELLESSWGLIAERITHLTREVLADPLTFVDKKKNGLCTLRDPVTDGRWPWEACKLHFYLRLASDSPFDYQPIEQPIKRHQLAFEILRWVNYLTLNEPSPNTSPAATQEISRVEKLSEKDVAMLIIDYQRRALSAIIHWHQLDKSAIIEDAKKKVDAFKVNIHADLEKEKIDSAKRAAEHEKIITTLWKADIQESTCAIQELKTKLVNLQNQYTQNLALFKQAIYNGEKLTGDIKQLQETLAQQKAQIQQLQTQCSQPKKRKWWKII